MLMDAAKMSEIIRNKKKKLLEDAPEVGTSEPASLNAQDVHELEENGRIEATLNSPEKSQSAVVPEDANNVGITEEQKKRMGRLRGFIGTLSV
jgi:hypothetical protein